MYVAMFRLENRPLTISLGPLFKKEWSGAVFVLFRGTWASPKGPKKVPKGPQVSGMYVPMCRLENKPLTESISPFL
jgi:hypothetical protein